MARSSSNAAQSGYWDRASRRVAFVAKPPQTTAPIRQTLHIGIVCSSCYNPAISRLPIHRWVHPDTFDMYREEGLRRGFKVVESGPLVRSSYHADVQANALTGIEGQRATAATEPIERPIGRNR